MRTDGTPREVDVDYVPFGLLALAAIVIGGVSILAVPPIGLLGIGMLGYYGWLHLSADRGGGDDPPR